MVGTLRRGTDTWQSEQVTEIYYHLERERPRLYEGLVLDDSQRQRADARFPEALDKFVPSVLSQHGWKYVADGAPHKDYGTELVFEMVRLAQFPHHPSRLSSLFCMASREELDMFRDKENVTPDNEWEIHAEPAPGFDIAWVGGSSFVDAYKRAESYWSGARFPFAAQFAGIEYLVQLPATVGKRVGGRVVPDALAEQLIGAHVESLGDGVRDDVGDARIARAIRAAAPPQHHETKD